MAYGDIKQNFAKGDLNKLWHYIELCKPYLEDEGCKDIEALKESLIRYSLIQPWSLSDGEEPKTFRVRFFAKEHEDFYYFLGMGKALDWALKNAGDEADFDLEAAITSRCLDRASKSTIPIVSAKELHQEILGDRARIIDFLEADGNLTDKGYIAQETGSSFEMIESVIESLKKKGILVVNRKNRLIRFDAAAARELLLKENE